MKTKILSDVEKISLDETPEEMKSFIEKDLTDYEISNYVLYKKDYPENLPILSSDSQIDHGLGILSFNMKTGNLKLIHTVDYGCSTSTFFEKIELNKEAYILYKYEEKRIATYYWIKIK